MIPFEKALKLALDAVKPPTATVEIIPLAKACGRVLAESPKARLSHPPANVSAMDGYAINGGDRSKAFRQVATCYAGENRKMAPLQKGQTVRIFTGAALPPKADTVVPQEQALLKGNSVSFKGTDGGSQFGRSQFVRAKGSDFSQGDTPLQKGVRITPYGKCLLAAMNCSKVRVYPRPKVLVLAIGNELLRLGSTPKKYHHGVVASSTVAIPDLLADAQVRDLGKVGDDPKRVLAKVAEVKTADLVITTGGVSVGAKDPVAKLIEAKLIQPLFNKVAVMPGKPLTLAHFQNSQQRQVLWLGLPGNPVSAMVATLLVATPMVAKMQGLSPTPLKEQLVTLTLGQNLTHKNGERLAFLRAKKTGRESVILCPSQDSANLTSLAGADCLLVRPPNDAPLHKGSKVSVLPLFSHPAYPAGYLALPEKPKT